MAWTIRGLKEYARVVFGKEIPEARGVGMSPKFCIKQSFSRGF